MMISSKTQCFLKIRNYTSVEILTSYVDTNGLRSSGKLRGPKISDCSSRNSNTLQRRQLLFFFLFKMDECSI